MDIAQNVLEIDNFILKSSTEITDLLRSIEGFENKTVLIHIVAYMHNTVLVQNLKQGLQKLIPHAKIVLLTYQDKSQTSLVVYKLRAELDESTLCHHFLREVQLENNEKNIHLDLYREQLFGRYFTDHLTNLPNMYQLRRDLQDNENSGLIIVNIDNFKIINNFYGFIAGDYVIEEVGKYLKQTLKEHVVYRLSADEYAIFLEQNMGFYELKEYLHLLYEKLKNIVVAYQDTRIYVDITLASCSNTKGDNLFSKVSMALKYAKEKGAPFWIYEEKMHFENEYERNLKISALVRHAVENSKIIPYFQAIVDNKSSQIMKYECLARLIDENANVVSPLIFIPVAKKIKVYSLVTQAIIEKSFEAFENNNYDFSINLSIEDIMHGGTFRFIIQKLKSSQASKRVIFELLESEAIQDYKKVERFIVEVKRYGAKVAIDDFGSGYSNFSYLTKISIDYIKIDGSLIKNIDVDKNSLLVVETIVEFAKKLGLKTIAEFVHSSSVSDKVKELGIDYSQGFYIDEPSVYIRTK